MKKIMISTFMLCIGVIVNAAPPSESNNLSSKQKGKGKITSIKATSNREADKETCTVEVSGSIKIAGTGFVVKCTATADNCSQATTEAVSAVKATFKAVKAAG